MKTTTDCCDGRGNVTPKNRTGLAQLVEHQAFNLRVAGSTPAIGTFLVNFCEALVKKLNILGFNQCSTYV